MAVKSWTPLAVFLLRALAWGLCVGLVWGAVRCIWDPTPDYVYPVWCVVVNLIGVAFGVHWGKAMAASVAKQKQRPKTF